MNTMRTDIRSMAGASRTGSVGSDLGQATRRLFAAVASWREKRASRRVLRDLTDHELSDIGLTRHDALREVSKSFFWD